MKVQIRNSENAEWETVANVDEIRIVMENDDYSYHMMESGDRNIKILLQSRPAAAIASLSQSSNHIILLPMK